MLLLPALCSGFTQSNPVPLFMGPTQALLAPPFCQVPQSKQLALGAPEPSRCSVSIQTRSRGLVPPPLWPTYFDSSGSQWHLLLSPPMRESPRTAEALVQHRWIE